MRNISFALTTQQFKDGSKSVTRRLGWWNLKPGDRLMGVVKSQWLKKGEHVIRLHPIKIISVRIEHLEEITSRDCVREGFPDLTTEEFIEMFMQHNTAKCKEHGRYTLVNRIMFMHLLLCPGCMYPVQYLGDYCGECLCEEDCGE